MNKNPNLMNEAAILIQTCWKDYCRNKEYLERANCSCQGNPSCEACMTYTYDNDDSYFDDDDHYGDYDGHRYVCRLCDITYKNKSFRYGSTSLCLACHLQVLDRLKKESEATNGNNECAK